MNTFWPFWQKTWLCSINEDCFNRKFEVFSFLPNSEWNTTSKMLIFPFTFLCLEQLKFSPRAADVYYTGIYMVKMLLLQFFLESRTMIVFKIILTLHLLACSCICEFLRKLYFNKWIITSIGDSENPRKHWLTKIQVRKVLY